MRGLKKYRSTWTLTFLHFQSYVEYEYVYEAFDAAIINAKGGNVTDQVHFLLSGLRCDAIRWEHLENWHFSRGYNFWTNGLILILKTPTGLYSCLAKVIICSELVLVDKLW